MSDKVYDVPAEWAKRAWVNEAKYEEMYKRSLSDPEGFWAEHGKRIDWFKPYTKVKDTSLRRAQCLDQMVRGRRHQRRATIASTGICPSAANQTAIIWEGDDPVEIEAHHLCRARRSRSAISPMC